MKVNGEKVMSRIFGQEAIRRYMLWAGADPVLADKALAGEDNTAEEVLPMNGDVRHSIKSFSEALDRISEILPDGGADFATGHGMMLTNHDDDYAGDLAQSGGAEPIFVGLTGERAVGKSFLTAELEKIGFVRVHPFNPGKALLRGYYVSRGATEEEAFSMTDGELKDKPAPRNVLPKKPGTDENYHSRYMMEQLGWFMANRIGLDSTIGCELRHWAGSGKDRILIDSVAYEADFIREMPNSVILGISVPEDKRKNAHIVADRTNEGVRQIEVDAVIVNEMNGADSLMKSFHEALRTAGLSLDKEEVTYEL